MKKNLFYLIVILFFFSACRKNEQLLDENVIPDIKNSLNQGLVVLGNKLENPYSVKNMRLAYKNLTGKSGYVMSSTIGQNIGITHYYVRFLPINGAQYDVLKLDSTLTLYPIPLDYEIISSGSNYQNTSGTPSWQYTAVKKSYKFNPTIKYEILEELYLPEQTETTNTSSLGRPPSTNNKFIVELVNEAMRITNNLQDTIKVNNGNKMSWYPSGKIRVFDTRLNHHIPLVGVQVRGRRWFNFKSTYTDENGNYSLGYFGGRTNLSVFYETGNFDVRSGTFGQAWYDGPHQERPWSLDINDGVQRFYAHVFRGARRYHYGNIGGLIQPNTSFVMGKIKYAAYDKSGGSQGDNWTTATQGGLLPDIRIWRFNSNYEYASDEIFSTTVHETAHTTHMNAMNGLIQYAQVSTIIMESWPIAVEWQITQMEYRERGINNYSDPFYAISASYPISSGYQYWTPSISQDYTSIFIDLVDDHNQAGRFGNTGIRDNVTGFTLASIESQFLKHVYGMYSLGEELKAFKPAGVTDEQISELLEAR